MRRWAKITDLTGREICGNDLVEGMIVEILGAYPAGGYACTAKDVNSTSNSWEDGSYDTILGTHQMIEVGLGDGDGFSGLVFSNGEWIEIGCGCHSHAIQYLQEWYPFFTGRDDAVFFSSGTDLMGLGEDISQHVFIGGDVVSIGLAKKTIEKTIWDKLNCKQREIWRERERSFEQWK